VAVRGSGDEGFTALRHHAVRSREAKMSKWQAEKAERNRQSLARLNKALPGIFPSAVLSWALTRPFVPPTPRLAVDSYWRAHPIRAVGWLVRLLVGAARLAAGLGSSTALASRGCRSHIERHPHLIANANTPRVGDTAVCVAS
jgi:hypothetical protein